MISNEHKQWLRTRTPKEKRKVKELLGNLNNKFPFECLLNDSYKLGGYIASMKVNVDKLRKYGFVDYKDYITSELWYKTRNRYLKSEMYQGCVICGFKKFHLHHCDYSKLCEEPLQEFIPLCEVHHNRLHSFLKRWNISLLLSERALRFNLGLDEYKFNLRIQSYILRKLRYSALECGIDIEWNLSQSRNYKIRYVDMYGFKFPLKYDKFLAIIEVLGKKKKVDEFVKEELGDSCKMRFGLPNILK